MSALSSWLSTLSAVEIGALVCLLAITVILKRASFGIGAWALLAWPGTLCHELAHALVGLLLGAKPCNMTLWPRNLGADRWQLGSVSFLNLRWWSAPWTAMAPLLLAPLSLWLTVHIVAPLWEAGDVFWGSGLLGVCAVILQASWPSTTDFRVAFPGLLVIVPFVWFAAT